MKNALLCTHQGYTDIIICIGMMYYYINHYNLIIIVRKELKDFLESIFKKYKNIKFFYFPIEKLCPIEVKMKPLIQKLLNDKNINIDIFLYCGPALASKHNGPHEPICNANYFYNIYSDYRLDKNIAYKYFNIERDVNLEEERYNKLINSIGSNYIIINQDDDKINRPRPKYGSNDDLELMGEINSNFFINKNLPVFNLSKSSVTIIDMIKIIENAKEIHLTSTFWTLIIYYIQLKYNLFSKIPIFLHSYVIPSRIYSNLVNSSFDKNMYCEFGSVWKILNKNI